MFPALCVTSVFGDSPSIGKVLVNLVIEFLPVGDDEECPVAGIFPQHLLGEEDHGKALAASLRVPENAQLPLILFNLRE